MTSVFGKYEKIRRLAQGGMGEVFLARQTGVLDRLVILKALRADLATEKEFVEQFLDEARVAATLNHPNIVAIYDVGDWYGTYYIAMEYIAGEDLSKLWYAAAKAGVGLPFQVSVRIVMEAAMGLDHAHRAKDVRGQPLNIVHRDISPQNIMVRADGVTKLVDFGIAKAANKSSRTQAGMVKGKLQYMSPEQVRGEALDGRSDQFSLGIVIWEMCTGRRLFKADTETNTLHKILKNPIPKPSQHVPGFPPELEAIVLRMLERDPARRYNNVGDVAARLKEYLDRASLQSGEVSVAAFVQQILGKELDERIRDLTPMEATDVGDRPQPQRPAFQIPGLSAGQSQSQHQSQHQNQAQNQPRSGPSKRPTPVPLPQNSDGDNDPPTTVVPPEDRPDRSGAHTRDDDGLSQLPLGPTGEFVVRKADGSVVHFQEWATLQQWVLDAKLSKDDQLSTDGRRFARLGDDPQLLDFFTTGEAAAAGRAWPRPTPVPPPADPAPNLTTTAKRLALGTETVPLGEPAEEPAAAPWGSDPRQQLSSTQNPLDPVDKLDKLDKKAALTGAFHLGSLPTSHTGQWQIGDPALQDALAQAAARAQQSPASPPSDPSLIPVSDPSAHAPVRAGEKKRIPVALWALLGVLGSFVGIALLLLVAFPDTFKALKDGDRSALAHAHAALSATRKDEPATLDAFLSNLAPLLKDDKGDVDAEVAAAFLQLERWRVLKAAALLSQSKSASDPEAALRLAKQYADRALAHAGVDDDVESTWARFAHALVAAAEHPEGAQKQLTLLGAAVPDLADEARADVVLEQGLSTLANPNAPPAKADLAIDAFDKRPAALRLLSEVARSKSAAEKEDARNAVAERLQKSPSDPRWVAARALLSDKKVEPVPAVVVDAGVAVVVDAGVAVAVAVVVRPPAVLDAGVLTADAGVPVVEETYESALAKAQKAQKSARTAEAAKMYRSALTKKPGDNKAELGLSWTQLDLGKDEAASKGFRNVAARDPSLAEAQFGLGEALRSAGKTTEALAAYEKYLEISPNGPDAETARNAIRALE